MKQLITTAFLILASLSLKAQQDPKLSLNMFQAAYYNPGAAGASGKFCLASGYRHLWMDMANAPSTFTFTSDLPFRIAGTQHGIGLMMVNDQFGFQNDLGVNLNYAFRLDLGPGSLGLGIRAGFVHHLFQPQWNGADIIRPETDPAIPQGSSDYLFDLGLGAYYDTDKMYVGLSVNHLNEPRYDYGADAESDNAYPGLLRNWYLMGGYAFQLPSNLELIPSFMLHTDFISEHIYLNTNFRYNGKYWIGVSYSVGGSLSALVGLELFNRLRLAYSYGFETSPLSSYNNGSHELFLSYCFALKTPKH